MKRHARQPRADWTSRVENLGLTYHSHPDGPYWDESACYELESQEVGLLEKAAADLHHLCIEAAEVVIERGWWNRLGIEEAAIPAIVASWERDDFSLYGRFDFAFDGASAPRLLEYNADTPTALLEASVVQWFWLQETFPDADQFNSIHERLIEAWKRFGGESIHFCSVSEHPEDEQTILYLRDTAEQAGIRTKHLFVEQIGWDATAKRFVDLENQPIDRCFKLYPWEWMWAEDFGKHLALDGTRFLEPVWKMLLSNKGLLPILWELFPGHPNLLAAYDSPDRLGENYVRKPKLSREGANVQIVQRGKVLVETPGDYGDEQVIYQDLAEIPVFDGCHPVFGAWIVDHEPAGLGIREDRQLVTGNLSRFIPHYIQSKSS